MSDAASPGRTFYAPSVRLVELSNTADSGEGGVVMSDVTADVISVEVTLVNHGSGQFTITLNNLYDSTPADRRAADEDAWMRREVVSHEFPAARFKYNDLKRVAFGTRMRVDFRYWPDQANSTDDAVSGAHQWVPMIAGPITEMQFRFGSGGATVQLTGEDDLFPLKVKVPKRTAYNGHSERSIVEEILQTSNLGLTLATPKLLWPGHFTDPRSHRAEAQTEGQSYLEYLQKFADRYDYELFVEFDDLSVADDAPETGDITSMAFQSFHLEPSRARIPPGTELARVVVLKREKNLVEFNPSIKVFQALSAVTVIGRNHRHDTPERIQQKVSFDALDDELPWGGTVAKPTPASLVRHHYFARYPNETAVANVTNLDQGRAADIARAKLAHSAREFMTVDGTTVGVPELRPGRYVQVEGFREPMDGYYYVTKTVHSFGADGYRTKFTARRPGMPFHAEGSPA